jgi:hypothetical protein
MPGAADVGFFDYIHEKNLVSWIKEGLWELPSLKDFEQDSLINALRRKNFRFFDRLTNAVMKCYYQNDRVLKAIGMEARPPFPQGYPLEEGDMALLIPVYERGRIYR